MIDMWKREIERIERRHPISVEERTKRLLAQGMGSGRVLETLVNENPQTPYSKLRKIVRKLAALP